MEGHRLFRVRDFHQMAQHTRERCTKRQLLLMHKKLKSSDSWSTSYTTMLPADISRMFGHSSYLARVVDARRVPHVLAFLSWYGQHNLLRRMSTRELGEWLVLCTRTLVHIYELSQSTKRAESTDYSFMRRALLRFVRCDDTNRASATHGLLRPELVGTGCALAAGVWCAPATTTSTAATRAADFLKTVTGRNVVDDMAAPVHSQEQQPCATFLDTTVCFDRAQDATIVKLCDWAKRVTGTFFGRDASCVLVVCFKHCVRALHSPGTPASVIVVVRSKRSTLCSNELICKLNSNGLLRTGQPVVYVTALHLSHGGAYVL